MNNQYLYNPCISITNFQSLYESHSARVGTTPNNKKRVSNILLKKCFIYVNCVLNIYTITKHEYEGFQTRIKRHTHALL